MGKRAEKEINYDKMLIDIRTSKQARGWSLTWSRDDSQLGRNAAK